MIQKVLVTLIVLIRKIRRKVGLPVADLSSAVRPIPMAVHAVELRLAPPTPKESEDGRQ